MDFALVAIALGDVVWIFLAFALGFVSRLVGLPPMVGFLVAGFLLNSQGIVAGGTLDKLSDLGITLLLFTVGLKLNLQTLARPEVWAVTVLHTSIVTGIFGFVIFGLALIGAPLVSSLSLEHSLLIAFALSFSSTVFVVKVLEEKGEIASLHGRIAIGVLIMQDIAAVVFLAISTGKLPSLWALSIVLLFPLKPLLDKLLERVGHGELLVLYGFLLALGGAEAFELVGLKGDLGALVLGVLIASHSKAEELAKTMLGFKNLFLLGFFLSIGMSGQLTSETLLVGALLAPLVLLKSALFFGLFTGFKLRARTALLTSLSLFNFSEFGLIVAAIGVSNGWISNQWLIVIAVALTLSFIMAAGLNNIAHQIYNRFRPYWQRMQRVERLVDDRSLDIDEATIAIVGMGGIGAGAYDKLRALSDETVIGIDSDPVTVKSHHATGRRVLRGDPSDADFWDRVQTANSLKMVMLALPNLNTNLAVLDQLNASSFSGKVVATAKFSDEIESLEQAGVDTVYNIYTEAGVGFASHAVSFHQSTNKI